MQNNEGITFVNGVPVNGRTLTFGSEGLKVGDTLVVPKKVQNLGYIFPEQKSKKKKYVLPLFVVLGCLAISTLVFVNRRDSNV